VTGAHGSPPLGSAAREATARPYIGKRRAPEVISDDQLSQMPPGCRCSRVLGRSGGWRLISTHDCPHHEDARYPGGMDDREERMDDRDPGADDE
jgi:hypothetical protein